MTTDTPDEDHTQRTPSNEMSKKIKTDNSRLMFPELAALKKEMDFERGARSAPNSRSCSFKNKPRPKGLRLQIEEPRRNSMPITSNTLSVSFTDIRTANGALLQRVRSFKTTSKGIENHGDSFRRRSNGSIASTGSAKLVEHVSDCNKRSRIPSDTSDDSNTTCSCASSTSPAYYRVLVMGEDGVGKTALTNQFMTSEYMGDLDISTNEYNDDVTVSVLLDGEESTLEFIDSTDKENCLDSLNVDAYLAVFSVDDRTSFDTAVNTLHRLRHDVGTDRAVILVANKIDLVRRRQVSSEEAKRNAERYCCKYAETSVTLNHNVDELLVGILRQIRLKLNPDVTDRIMCPISSDFHQKENRKCRGPRKLLNKLFKKTVKQDSLCEDLFDL